MTSTPAATKVGRLPLPEFIALFAMMFAMTAFSIDAMLPAMPEIAAELTPDAPNRAQLIVTSLVFGMGFGTLITGPLSDALGRRPVIIGGAVLYCLGAVLAWIAPTLELVLAARVLQGLGVAGPRVAAMALVRDLYSGRRMAQIISFIMTIFTLVTASAPLVGSFIIAAFGWRGIFPAFTVFAVIAMLWFRLRQEETLPPSARKPLNARALFTAAKEVLTHRLVGMVILVLSLCFACLFSVLASSQQVFDLRFGRGDTFPFWFAMMAVMSGGCSLINARLVVRLGMRRMVTTTFLLQTINSGLMSFIFLSGILPEGMVFWVYLYWTATIFFLANLTIGNLNALALEPMGHIAGTASSIVTAVATILSVLIAAPVSFAFDGTPVPMMVGIFLFCLLALGLMIALPKQNA